MFQGMTLTDYDTDKPASYLATYEREFGGLAEQPMALLELGVQRGGSVLLWRDALPKATIVGLDLNPIELDTASDRVRLYQGFQQDPEVLARIASENAPAGFDVVVDDASHLGKYTAESFWTIFPNYLKPGGVYILDDCDSAYRSDWSDGHHFSGDLTTLGIGRDDAANRVATGRVARAEALRRRARAAARPIAERIAASSPALRVGLEKAYMRLEGATLQTRFRNHEHGMIGFGKQLADAVAVEHITRHSGLPRQPQLIESVTFLPQQIVIRKVL